MDYFKTDWAKKMKTDPTANFLLNNHDKLFKYEIFPYTATWENPRRNKHFFFNKGDSMGEIYVKDPTRPVHSLAPRPQEVKKPWRYMTKEYFDTNQHFQRAISGQQNKADKNKQTIGDGWVGYYLRDNRNVFRDAEPEAHFVTPSDDDEYRYAVGAPESSFWRNTAPTNLYSTSNTFIRSNPFQSIKKQHLEISTPLITFSS